MLVFLVACTLPKVPEVEAATPAPALDAWAARLEEPGPIVLESRVSARWAVSTKGLVDLDDPKAKAAGLKAEKIPMVLSVHLLRHPVHGTFVIDTGIDRAQARGERGPLRGVVRAYVAGMEPVAPLGELVAGEPLRGVLLTHLHLDHVLGLRDVPPGVPVYAGAGEQEVRAFTNLLLKRTWKQLSDGLTLTVFDPATAAPLGEAGVGWDLLGDGSLWAIAAPGHTPGSTAYLARTTEGPVLFVGDTSHTRWGWDHGVTPGTFTHDPAGNAESLARLEALVAAHPSIRVVVGHEEDGADAVSALAR